MQVQLPLAIAALCELAGITAEIPLASASVARAHDLSPPTLSGASLGRNARAVAPINNDETAKVLTGLLHEANRTNPVVSFPTVAEALGAAG